ncbi:MAG: fibronectin type III domain-containing protein [Chitinophagales bacterium]
MKPLILCPFLLAIHICSAQFIETEKLWNPASPGSDYYGDCVKIYGDKCIISGRGQHYAEIRSYEDGKWVFNQVLYTSDNTLLTYVGMNSEFVFLGKPYQDKVGIPTILDAGFLYIYKWNGYRYSLIQSISSPTNSTAKFAQSFEIDGDRIAVSLNTVTHKAATYKYNGFNWIFEQYIDPIFGGGPMALKNNSLIIGSVLTSVDGKAEQGVANVFYFDGSTWKQNGYLTASDGLDHEHFGTHCVISDSTLYISKSKQYLGQSGAIYKFAYINDSTWIETEKIEPQIPSKYFGEFFDVEGSNMVIYATDLDYNPMVYYYIDTDTGWTFQQSFTSSDLTIYDEFGQVLDLAGNHLLCGAPRCQNYAVEPGYRGAVYAEYLCSPITNSIFDTICESSEYIFGGAIYTESGTYFHTFSNEFGCDSIVTLNLTVVPIDTSINIVGTTLNSGDLEAEHQWYNCDTHLNIADETSTEFTPSATGSYACILQNDYCIDTTSCYFIEVISCFPPASTDVINITTTSAKVTWIGVADAVKYQLQYRELGTLDWNTNLGTATFKNLNALAPGTTYEYRVRTICVDDTSTYTDIESFTTL